MRALVERIEVHDGICVPVEYVDGLDELGHWDEVEGIVRIKADQAHGGKVLVLIHEMMHMGETAMIAHGMLGRVYRWFIRPIWGEALITQLSSFMFQWMARTGMLHPKLITRDEAMEFIESMEELPE